MKELVLAGFGGHGLSVLDSIQKAGMYKITGYTDPVDRGNSSGIPWLGTDNRLKEIYEKGCKYAFVATGYLGVGDLRNRLYDRLKKTGFKIPEIIDPSAVTAEDVHVGEGTYVGKNSVVNTGSHIEEMCIINTGAIVEHGNRIGAFSHVATGAVLCGDITVGRNCFIGAGSVIIQGISIADNSVIGAGSTVLSDVPESGRVYGVWK